MLSLLQNLFIIVLTPIAGFTVKINDKVRNISIQFICFLFPLYFIYYYTWARYRDIMPAWLQHHHERHIMGCLLLLLLILFSLNQVPTRVIWNKWIMYPMVISGLWMLIISFIHPVGSGYRVFALMLIFIYPCMYFIWNNRGDYEQLFDPIARALMVIGILFFISCFILAAHGEMIIVSGRCMGQLMDPNMFSMVGMASSCGSLYLLIRDRESHFRFVIYSASLGSGFAIVWMGQSRLSLMVCFVNIIAALIFYLRYSEKSKTTVIVIKLVCIIAVVINMLLLSSFCISLQKGAEAQVKGTVQAEQETDASVSEEPAQTQESQNTTVIDRLSADENATLNTYSAGRIEIWKGYWQFLNVFGNDFSQADWNALTHNTVTHAHNNFLEMSFRFGVPMGILFFLLETVACLKALQMLFCNRRKRIVLLMPILFTVMFLFESMFDIATLPFERDAPFYFYLAMIPMACQKTESSS